jgi:hypothetical protein
MEVVLVLAVIDGATVALMVITTWLLVAVLGDGQVALLVIITQILSWLAKLLVE